MFFILFKYSFNEIFKANGLYQKDGSFNLNISTPLHDKEVEVVVIINEKPSYNFSGLIGILRWKGDPLKCKEGKR